MKKPQKYWHERAKVLLAPGATMAHEEFFRQCMKDAKAHVEQRAKPWFAAPFDDK